MNRRETTLDPAVAAELAELERALADEPSPFTALVADVRAERPVMAPAFAAKLDARVDEARTAPPRRSWLVWSPAAGMAAALVVAVVIVSNRDGGSSPSAGPALKTAPPSATQLSPAPATGAGTASSDAAKSAAPQAAAGGTSASEAAPSFRAPGSRKVERSTSLELSTGRADVQAVADNVIGTVQRFGGIVDSSQIASSDAEASAVFSLRIPTRRLDAAVAALSKLAHVASLSQGSTDITGSFVSAASRLGDARAERRGLLKALGHATTTQEIDALKARLRDNRSQIAALKGELNGLRRRADLARVDVTVSGNGHKGATGGGTWTPRDAARDALRVLEVAAGVLLVGLAAGVPLALIAGMAALGTRSARRRRREGALDPV
jgi:hypothetical protein